MIVRELVTAIKWVVDKSGLNAANNATNQLKNDLANTGQVGAIAGNQAATSVSKIGTAAQTAASQAKGANSSLVTSMSTVGTTAQTTASKTVAATNAIAKGVNQVSTASRLLNGALMGIGMGIYNTFMGALGGIRQNADEMMNLDGKLRTITNSTKERLQLEKELYEMSQNSRADYKASGDLYFNMARSTKLTGLNQKENLKLTDTVNKALVVSGADAMQASATVLQLSQALGSGILQGDELRSLNENASFLMNGIADYFGTTVGGLKQLGKDGELTSEKVAKAILYASKQIDEEFEKMPLTMGQAYTIIGNMWSKGIQDFEDSTGFFSTAAHGLIEVFKGISSIVGIVVNRLGGVKNAMRILTVVVSSLALALIYINFQNIVGALAKVTSAVSRFATALGLANMQLWLIAIAIAIVIIAIQDIYTWINGGDSIIGRLIGPWEDFKKRSESWLNPLIEGFKTLYQNVQTFIEQLKQGFSEIDLSGVMPTFQALMPVFGDLLGVFLGLIAAVILFAAYVVSEFINFMNSGSMVANNLKLVFQYALDTIIGLIRLATALFRGNWGEALDIVKGLFSNFGTFAVNILKNIASAIGQYVLTKLNEAKDAVMGFLGWSNNQTAGALANAKNSNTVNLEQHYYGMVDRDTVQSGTESASEVFDYGNND